MFTILLSILVIINYVQHQVQANDENEINTVYCEGIRRLLSYFFCCYSDKLDPLLDVVARPTNNRIERMKVPSSVLVKIQKESGESSKSKGYCNSGCCCAQNPITLKRFLLFIAAVSGGLFYKIYSNDVSNKWPTVIITTIDHHGSTVTVFVPKTTQKTSVKQLEFYSFLETVFNQQMNVFIIEVLLIWIVVFLYFWSRIRKLQMNNKKQTKSRASQKVSTVRSRLTSTLSSIASTIKRPKVKPVRKKGRE